MSGRIRPSARKKTLNNVMASSLSVTDKKCIEEVFEKFEFQKDEIIGLINGQETLQKALAEKIAETETQSQNFKVLTSDHRTLQQSFDNLKGLYETEKAKVEKAKEKCIYFAKELQTAKAEVKRLKEYEDIRPVGCPNCNRGNFSSSKFCSHCGTQLRGKAKEMVGDTE